MEAISFFGKRYHETIRKRRARIPILHGRAYERVEYYPKEGLSCVGDEEGNKIFFPLKKNGIDTKTRIEEEVNFDSAESIAKANLLDEAINYIIVERKSNLIQVFPPLANSCWRNRS